MSDLAAFLAARLDEDEAAAKAAAERESGEWAAVENYGVAVEADNGGIVVYDEGCPTCPEAAHIARHDPARVLREVAADRELLAALRLAKEFSDHMFGSPQPEGVLSGEVPGERMRAATQVLTLERVVAIRAARFSDHPDYDPAWSPQ